MHQRADFPVKLREVLPPALRGSTEITTRQKTAPSHTVRFIRQNSYVFLPHLLAKATRMAG
jgi:hypothetical protein